MALKQRGEYWWIDVTVKPLPRCREPLGTTDKRQARKLHDEKVVELRRIARQSAARGKTWLDASKEWRADRSDKRSIADDELKLKALDVLWADKALVDITRDEITAMVKMKMSGELAPRRDRNGNAIGGCGGATANRWVALVVAILRAAEIEWGWDITAPKVRRQKEPKRKIRFMTMPDVLKVCENVGPFYRDLVVFSIGTGLRQANACQLRWDQVDLEAAQIVIDAEKVKNGEMLPIPLNDQALAIVTKYKGKHKERVFVNGRGQPIQRPRWADWKAALAKAGVGDFRWHDLRHTFASWHIQAGTSETELMELGGWQNKDMVRKYAHLNQSTLAARAGATTVQL